MRHGELQPAAGLFDMRGAEAHEAHLRPRGLLRPVGREQRIRIGRQVAGEDRRLALAVEGLAIDPLALDRRADDDGQGARLDTRLPAEDLLDQCLSIERSMKRERIERWGPRTIDLDLLTYEGEERTGERLTLPHPRMTERGFVLLPLADIAPGLLVRGRTVADWAANAETAGIERIDARPDWWKRDDA